MEIFMPLTQCHYKAVNLQQKELETIVVFSKGWDKNLKLKEEKSASETQLDENTIIGLQCEITLWFWETQDIRYKSKTVNIIEADKSRTRNVCFVKTFNSLYEFPLPPKLKIKADHITELDESKLRAENACITGDRDVSDVIAMKKVNLSETSVITVSLFREAKQPVKNPHTLHHSKSMVFKTL